MQNVVDRVPPEAWPFIDRLFEATVAVAAIWLALSIFVYWRRRATNLTPVTAPRRSKKAQPDFLEVDHKARRAAMERGEAFERELQAREAEEARSGEAAGLRTAMTGTRLAKLATIIMSVFTLVTMIVGSILNIGKMGELMQTYSTTERIAAVIREHPVGSTVAVIVIVAGIYRFFHERKWRLEHKGN